MIMLLYSAGEGGAPANRSALAAARNPAFFAWLRQLNDGEKKKATF